MTSKDVSGCDTYVTLLDILPVCSLLPENTVATSPSQHTSDLKLKMDRLNKISTLLLGSERGQSSGKHLEIHVLSKQK